MMIMFSTLVKDKSKLKQASAALEVYGNSAVATDKPSGDDAPTTRFGAIAISLDSDDRGISIVEQSNSDNTVDYSVYICGEILQSADYAAELVTLLHTLSDTSKVTIFINSPGGSLMSGSAIAGAISASRAKVTTVAVGMVASAAAFIWSHGHTVTVEPTAIAMFHMSSHGDYGNSKMIAINAENTVKYVTDISLKKAVDLGLLTPEDVEDLVDRRRDVYLDAATIVQRLGGTTA